MEHDKVYETRKDQIVALSDLLADYFYHGGKVAQMKIKRITSYRFTLALMKSDGRLAPVASKFTEVINAVEKGNFKAATRLSGEALTLADGVDA